MWPIETAYRFSRTHALFFPPLLWVTSLRHWSNTTRGEKKGVKALELRMCLFSQKSLLQWKALKYSLAIVLVPYSPLQTHAFLHDSVGTERFSAHLLFQKLGEFWCHCHLTHPVHMTSEGRRKLWHRRGSGRWFSRFSQGGWNETQWSSWKVWLFWAGWLALSHSTVGSFWLTCEIPFVRGRERIMRTFSHPAVLWEAERVASYLHFLHSNS